MDRAYAIFDMDGTLVDSMALWKGLGREYLAGKGVRGPVEAVLARSKPMTMMESAALFIAEFKIPGTAREVAGEMNAMMAAHYRRDIPLKPGVQAYLEGLKRRGVRMCVASATAQALVEACLSRLGVTGYFDFLLSCEAVGAGKDRPDVFLKAAAGLGAAPGEIAVYEDAPFALRTARAAGFYTLAVYDENAGSSWEELAALGDEGIFDWLTAAGSL